MTVLRLYQIDAFHHQVLRGNPAAVIPLAQWLPDELLQAIALENNLSETAFFLPEQDGAFPLRWFTPAQEVRLCGHATLATAHALFQEIGITRPRITFQTLSGSLHVERLATGYRMDFPADAGTPINPPPGLAAALGTVLQTTIAGKDDLLVIVAQQQQVADLTPDLAFIQQLPYRGLIVSAPGTAVDFVSRCFYPRFGIAEDPVTGSAHTLLTPYWAKVLGKNQLSARQISARVGILTCQLHGDRVWLDGQAVTYLRGEVFLPD
jgi:PhzF family phenazine biosynthesis protein